MGSSRNVKGTGDIRDGLGIPFGHVAVECWAGREQRTQGSHFGNIQVRDVGVEIVRFPKRAAHACHPGHVPIAKVDKVQTALIEHGIKTGGAGDVPFGNVGVQNGGCGKGFTKVSYFGEIPFGEVRIPP